VRKFPYQDWADLGEGIRVNEPAASVGSQLFKILDGAGYTGEDITTIARTLRAYVD